MSKKYTGHCACGQVTYGFDTEPTFIANSQTGAIPAFRSGFQQSKM